MDILLQQLINGLTLGSVYALVALGYTMVYGIIGLINFAHGEVVMIGAMVSLSVITSLLGAHVELPTAVLILAGLVVAIAVCMAIAYAMEKIAYRPLRKAPRLAPLITAIGMSIILQNVALVIWGRNYRTFPTLLNPKPYNVLGASMTDLQMLIVVLAALLMGGLVFVVQRTRLGMAMRATAQNPQVAGLMGIDINVVISAAFVIGAALAAVAGLMVMTYYGIAHYYMGFLLGLKAFTAAVLGGIGNLAGAMLGGVLLGIIEALGAGYIGDISNICGFPWLSDSLREQCATSNGYVSLFGSNYQDVFAFFVLILVLIFRPSGLLGERVSERA
ncbi:MAG TPA: branched-chain amino acid ABC transporter permease [Casimicrobiaceae bacterium]|nr:branched-chain amino acid ABC transporter permease [Casimicrobiaceae bacterium]